MDRIIQSPGKYIQGADVINRLGEYLKPLAERWLNVRKMRSTVCVASRRLRSVAQFSVSVAEKPSILPKHWHISWVFR